MREGSMAGEHAGPVCVCVGGGYQMVIPQLVEQAETVGPAAGATFCCNFLTFWLWLDITCINLYMTYYIYMTYIYMYTYTYTYIQTYMYIYIHSINIYIFSINIYTQVTWSCIKCLRLYTLILTITIKDNFLWENEMILDIKIQGGRSRS